MTPETFITELQKEDDTDYGLCATPCPADKGIKVLMKHFLGDDWYVTMSVSRDQVYTEAIYTILERYPNQSLTTRILNLLTFKFPLYRGSENIS